MKPYMDEQFMLSNATAQQLYHEAAADMPIYEYYSRMNADMIVDNARIENLSQLLLFRDHQAWRAMLSAGVPEELIRGNGDDWDKFLAYARVLPQAIGNPLHHLTHMTLKELFGIDEVLSESTARSIWDRANERLSSPEYRVRGLMARWQVQSLCTNEEPLSQLKAYQLAQASGMGLKLRPIFCPDRLLLTQQTGFADYVARLGDASGISIRSLADLLAALEKRMDYFHAHGCRAADHSMDHLPRFLPDEEKANRALRAALSGGPIKPRALASYQSLLYTRLGLLYARRGWVQHYHLSALRNTNQRMFALYGNDTGFDALSDEPVAYRLSQLLDAQDRSMSLPKTVLYSANPAQNAALMALLGSHQQNDLAGKMQMGAPWRFQNHRRGIETQLKDLANMSLIRNHIGMTAGGASISNFSRHAYFRRILCDMLGKWVEAGEYPADMTYLKATVKAIAFHNAAEYFD